VKYPRAYDTSKQRVNELPNWIHRYNWHRPHGSLKAQTPISRLGLTADAVSEKITVISKQKGGVSP
jgi:transposase InsO family protein